MIKLHLYPSPSLEAGLGHKPQPSTPLVGLFGGQPPS